jgi:hypothetical protein
MAHYSAGHVPGLIWLLRCAKFLKAFDLASKFIGNCLFFFRALNHLLIEAIDHAVQLINA